MNYNIILLTQATDHQQAKASFIEFDCVFIKGEGAFSDGFVRDFLNSGEDFEVFSIASKYADFHLPDFHRGKSGAWMAAVSTAKTLQKRNNGEWLDSERIYFESSFATVVNWLQAGHFKSALSVATLVLPTLSEQKFKDFATELLLPIQGYVDEFY